MKRTFLIFGWALSVMLTACKDDDNELAINSNNPKQTAIDKAVDEQLIPYMRDKKPGRVIVAVSKNGTTKFYAYGQESETLPTEKNVYEIGSVTKTFTGLLIAREVKAGTIKLDVPVTQYMDPANAIKLEKNGKAVTLKQLLTHTSGLPENPPSIEKGLTAGTLDPENPAKNYSRNDLIADMKSVTLQSDPGQKYAYSNFGYAILGEVLKVVTKKTFSENVQSLNTQLGLSDTGITLTSDQQSRAVKGHNEDTGKEVPAWEMGEAASAGALRSTAQDMIKYINAYITSAPTTLPLKETHAPLFNLDNTQQVGYAWNRVGTAAPYAVWHNGETNGQRCFVGFFEDTKAGVVILSDRAEGTTDQLDVVGLTLLVATKDQNQ